MSPQQFLEEMQKIAEIENLDERYARANELLCTTLIENGFIEGIELYNKIIKRD